MIVHGARGKRHQKGRDVYAERYLRKVFRAEGVSGSVRRAFCGSRRVAEVLRPVSGPSPGGMRSTLLETKEGHGGAESKPRRVQEGRKEQKKKKNVKCENLNTFRDFWPFLES